MTSAESAKASNVDVGPISHSGEQYLSRRIRSVDHMEAIIKEQKHAVVPKMPSTSTSETVNSDPSLPLRVKNVVGYGDHKSKTDALRRRRPQTGRTHLLLPHSYFVVL